MSTQINNKRYPILLLCILVLAALVRFLYAEYTHQTMILEPDSQGYYYEHNFFKKEDILTNIFNVNRTPGYPVITSLAMSLTGQPHPIYKSSEFFKVTPIILFTQTMVGLVGLVFLCILLTNIGISRKWSLLFTLFTGLNIYQFMWERAFLTEATYIGLLTATLWAFVSLIHTPRWKMGLLFILLCVWGFLVRPGGLAVPYILLPIILLIHRTKKTLQMIIILLALYSTIPLSYSYMNQKLHNFKGISINTDFVLFGRILRYNLPVNAAQSITPNLYKKVTDYREAGGNTSIPWYFFVAYNNEIYGKMGELKAFNRAVITDQFVPYTQTIIKEIPIAFSDTYVEEVLYRNPNGPKHLVALFDTLTFIITTLQQGTIIFLVLLPLTIWQFFTKQTKLHAFLMALALLEAYQLFSSLVFGGAWEWARHMITTQTYLFFLCFWWIGKTMRIFLAQAQKLR